MYRREGGDGGAVVGHPEAAEPEVAIGHGHAVGRQGLERRRRRSAQRPSSAHPQRPGRTPRLVPGRAVRDGRQRVGVSQPGRGRRRCPRWNAAIARSTARRPRDRSPGPAGGASAAGMWPSSPSRTPTSWRGDRQGRAVASAGTDASACCNWRRRRRPPRSRSRSARGSSCGADVPGASGGATDRQDLGGLTV